MTVVARWATVVSLVVWAGSWRIMYLEVTRWRHLDARLRFVTPEVPPGFPVPRAGRPVRAARAAAVVAPVVSLVLLWSSARSARR
ncbi:hypothetical protein [Amycolatopsis sp. NPDC051371]|uniref:hypothetical protein n=1 Tax=Amycolatopsis sp. NPDC051371 TaxID=3155800 RepID=UPI00341320EB